MRVLHDWLLTPERVAVHWPSRTAVVADLHLGYDEARRRRGDAIPEESVLAPLEPLGKVLCEYRIGHLVLAGDLLEAANCREALASFETWCREKAIQRIALVPGNHDAGLPSLASDTPLTIHARGVRVAEWQVIHGEGRLPNGPLVQGHEHPWVRWSPKRRTIRPRSTRSRIASGTIDASCYLSDSRRLILPAYSQEAAGVNVLSSRRWHSFRCHAIAGDRVVDLGEVSTLNRRLSATNAHYREPTAD